jgi:hypothetical protein
MYNVTWGAYVQPLLQQKSCKFYILWLCVRCLRYPVCNEHASYRRLWPVTYSSFPHHLTIGKIFEKKIFNIKCVFWFSGETFPLCCIESQNIYVKYSQTQQVVFGYILPTYFVCVLIFSAPLVWNISHSKNNWTGTDKKYIMVFT